MMIPVPKAGILGEVRGKAAAREVEGITDSRHYHPYRGGGRSVARRRTGISALFLPDRKRRNRY